jgi:hypothetical protein
MEKASVTITLPIDHPNLNAILDLARDSSELSGTGAGGEIPVLDILERLLAPGLNDGERKFLLLLARRAPAVVPHPELVEISGSPQKLGNITAGLFRRWRARGGSDSNAPWMDVLGSGRRMEREPADLILRRLTTEA